MRIILILIALIVFLAVSPQVKASEQVFFTDLPDIPVMQGLFEQTSDQINFGNASGRVVQAFAQGQGLSADKVIQFYAETLPELGWTQSAPGQFYRGDEVLKITSEQLLEGGIRIQVALAPKP